MGRKQSIITFKADESMLAALEKIPNKSEFIRTAILAALDESCPFCAGTGKLNPHQRMHWSHFTKEHRLIHCKECDGIEVRCTHHGGRGEDSPGNSAACEEEEHCTEDNPERKGERA